MKILVCISNVPDTTSKINFTDNNTKFDTNGVQFVINPNDEFGLTRAMWFKEKAGAQVTVVTVGGASSEPTLRKALAIGADEGIRVDADPTDSFFVAQQLADVIKNGAYDLIIAGKESIDYNGGVVPGMISALTSFDFVDSCVGIEIEGDNVTATREIDGGKEVVSAKLPLVIGVQKGVVEEKDLRIPNMRGIMAARTKALTVVIPIASDIRSTVVQYDKPAPKSAVKLVDANDIDGLIALLHNEAKVI